MYKMPLLSELNIRGNPLDQNSAGELLEVLKLFPSLSSLDVIVGSCHYIFRYQLRLLYNVNSNIYIYMLKCAHMLLLVCRLTYLDLLETML